MLGYSNMLLTAVTRFVSWVGMLSLLAAVIITCADVVLRKLGTGGIYGSVDLIQLTVMAAVFLSIPYAFLTRSHVVVTILADRLPGPVAVLLHALASGLSGAFMFAIGWYGLEQYQMQTEYGDVSMIFGVPMTWYWLPLLGGAFLSVAVTMQMLVESMVAFIRMLTPVGGHE